MSDNKWYVIYVRSQFERAVYKALNNKNIMSFLPEQTEVRQWSDRKKKIDVPLFPGYLFVKIDKKQFYEVLSARGVVKFVNFAGDYATVGDEEIERIRLLLANDLKIEVIDDYSELLAGDHFYLDEGPLSGQQVEFVRLNGRNRGLFKLEAIGKHLLVNLPLPQVLS